MGVGQGIMINIGADASQAVRELKGFNRALGSEMTGLDKFKKGVDSAFLPAVGVMAAAGAAAYKFAGQASDLAETQSKAGVIFGESVTQIEQWAKVAPQALGQTVNAATDAAATMAIFGKAAGLTGSELTSFSTDLVDLSSDIASFNNVDSAEAVQALGSALRGEYESARKYGILLNDATLKQRAFEMGLYSGTGALDMQAKVLAAQQEIFAQTTDTQGDFARTSEGAAHQSKILAASVEQLTTDLGKTFLPILEKVTKQLSVFAGWASENQGLVMGLAGAITAIAATIIVLKIAMSAWVVVQWALNSALLANPIVLIIVGIAALIAAVVLAYHKFEWFKNIVDFVWEGIYTAIQTVVVWFQEEALPIIKTVFGVLSTIVKAYFTVYKTVWDGIWAATEAVVVWFQETLLPIITEIVDALSEAFTGMGEVVQNVFNGIKTVVQNVWDFIRPILDALMDKVRAVIAVAEKIGNVAGAVGGAVGLSLPVPAGDQFTRTTRTQPMLSRAGSASTTAQITINTGVGDPVAIAKEIRRVLNKGSLRTGVAL